MALAVPSSVPHNSVSTPKLEKAGYPHRHGEGYCIEAHPSIHPISQSSPPLMTRTRDTLGNSRHLHPPFRITYLRTTPPALRCTAHPRIPHHAHLCRLGRSSHQAYLQYAAGYPSYGNPPPPSPILISPRFPIPHIPHPGSHLKLHFPSHFTAKPLLGPGHRAHAPPHWAQRPGRRKARWHVGKALPTNSDLSFV